MSVFGLSWIMPMAVVELFSPMGLGCIVVRLHSRCLEKWDRIPFMVDPLVMKFTLKFVLHYHPTPLFHKKSPNCQKKNLFR